MSIKTRKIISAWICAIGVAEYYAHYHMKPYTNNSYHITIDDDSIWPQYEYCTSYNKAYDQFDKFVKHNPKANYKVIYYPVTVRGFIYQSISEIPGSQSQIVEENQC